MSRQGLSPGQIKQRGLQKAGEGFRPQAGASGPGIMGRDGINTGKGGVPPAYLIKLEEGALAS